MVTARWATARQDTTTMATGDDDDGDGATGDKVFNERTLLGAGGECSNQPSTGVAKVMDRTAAGKG